MTHRVLWLLMAVSITAAACGGGSEEAADTQTAADVVAEPAADPAAEPVAEPPPPPPPPPSLLQRLGGREALVAVVDDFATRVLADRRIKRFFRRVNRDQFEDHVVNFICQGAGGECEYGGRSMQEAHQGMHLTDAHFDALVEDLTAALDAAHVADAEKAELLGILTPMRAQIIPQAH